MAFQGFRAISAVDQAVAATTFTEVVFGTEEFDTEGAFASDRFTVPPGLDGRYACFYAGVVSVGIERVDARIQRSTDGGSNWINLGADREGEVGLTGFNGCAMPCSGPVLLTEGDIFRVAVQFLNADSVRAGADTFFSCSILPEPVRAFRGTPSTTQAATSNTTTEIDLGTESFDTDGDFASNRFTVPVGLDGAVMAFFAGCSYTGVANSWLLVQRSQDAGATWGAIAITNGASAADVCIATGPIVVRQGEIFRAAHSPRGGGTTIQNVERTYFSGYVVSEG